ncbi:MAG: FHA domain-containing protein [Caldimonas sp.]
MGQAALGAPLALLEAIDRDGLVRQSWRIDAWPVTIGRALDNDVVLSDPHVAAHHATLDVQGGEGAAATILVSTGTTRNGIVVGRDRIGADTTRALPDSGRDLDLHIGRTQLRLRVAGHALGAEQAMTPVVTSELRFLPTFVLALAVLAVVLANTWVDSDPDGLARNAGTAALTAIAGGAIWCGVWALLSKTFTRQGHFGWHVRVFVIASLVTLALAVLPALVAFAFSLPWVTDFSFIAVYATIAAAIYFHLLAVEPGRERLMRAVAVSGFLAGVALSLWFNVQRTGRFGEELYMNHLFMPQLRVARPKTVDAFIDGLAPMQAILDRKAKEQTGGDADARGADDEE